MIRLLKRISTALLACLCVTAALGQSFHSPNISELQSGWRLSSADAVTSGDEAVSRAEFDASRWYQRVVLFLSRDGGQTWGPPLDAGRDPSGRIFNWDREADATMRASFASRLTPDDRSKSLAPAGRPVRTG